MHSLSFRLSRTPISHGFRILLTITAGLAMAFASGCGVSPTVPGTTLVTVLATSTGNDQMTSFHVFLNSLTLTNKAGDVVTVFSTPQSAEYMHLNGSVEPLTNVTLPQDTYTSATATIGQAFALCLAVEPGTLLINGGFFGDTNVTVNLPAPITVTGAHMGLALDLQVASSLVLPTCVTNASNSPPIKPVFNLIPVTIAAQPTNSANGMATGLHGLIATVAASGASFSVTAADGPTWQVETGSGTVFQGIANASQLGAGLPVDMDAAIQADGSLLARRVAVYDTNPTNLSVSNGLLLSAYAPTTLLDESSVENQGLVQIGQLNRFNYSTAVYQTSGQLTNIHSLPFTASFNAANMIDGQNVFISIHAPTYPSQYFTLTTITLLPQTINGTVNAVSTSGGFTTYTVALAPYDPLTFLGVQPSQSSVPTNPGTVVVYVDSNTQLLNSNSIAVGSLLRFNGLIFNDNGTLRMDCAQISNGVTE